MKIRLVLFIASLLLSFTFVFGLASFLKDNDIKTIIPKPKIMEMGGELESISINDGFEKGFSENHASFFEWLNEDFSKLEGPRNFVKIELMPSQLIPDSLNNFIAQKSSYYIKREDKQISIVGADTAGVLNGLTTLKKLINQNNGKLSEGYIIDWPDHKIRAFHFVARVSTEKEVLNLLEKARLYNFNTFVVQIAHGFKLNSLSRVKYWRYAMERNFLAKFAKKTREFGLDFIPEIKFLTHQKKLFKDDYPELMYNRWTYDPTLIETQVKVKEIVDEILTLTSPRAIHIGHDEVVGVYLPRSERSTGVIPNADKALPANYFKESVLFLHNYLSSKGIETWMWGDMFLQREDFPVMYPWTLNSSESYARVIDEIPKDIVICDWHYLDEQSQFPSVNYFSKKGFRVIGAPWKKETTIQNFSLYVDQYFGEESGMMATTWFYVPNKEWGTVDNIIKTSSEYFWNAN